MFATEQLHLRTRQLDELLARQPAVGSATEQPGKSEPAAVPEALGTGAVMSGQRKSGGEIPAQDSVAWMRPAARPAAAAQDDDMSATADRGATEAAQGAASSTSDHASSCSSQPDVPWGSSVASGHSKEAATASGGGARGGCEEEVAEGHVARDDAAAFEGRGSVAQPAQMGRLYDTLLQERQSAPQPRTQLPTRQHPHPEDSGDHDHLEPPALRRRSEVTVWAVASPPASSPIRCV